MKDLTPLAYSFLPAGITLAGDLWVHFPVNQKLVAFRKKGQALNEDDSGNLAKLEPSQILVAKAEYQVFVKAFATHVAMLGASNTNDPALQTVVKNLLGNLSGDASQAAPDRTILRKALDSSVELVTELISKFKTPSAQSFLDALKKIEKSQDPLDCHHRYASALAVMGMISLGKTDMQELSDISLAGLVHDVGLTTLSKQLVDKHLRGDNEYTRQEKAIYMRHTEIGIDLLRASIPNLSEGVVRIVLQHHENFDGSGFKGIIGAQIYRPARMLCIVDSLVAKIDSVSSPMDIVKAFDALDMENRRSTGGGIYDADMLATLKQTASR